MAGHSLGGVMA